MVNKEILKEAKKQIGFYLKEIIKERGHTPYSFAQKYGYNRTNFNKLLNGEIEYTIDKFLSIIKDLDVYFYLADKEGEHLNFDHMIKKSDPDNSMDFREE